MGHVDCREQREDQMCKVLEENVTEKHQSEYLDVDDRIILELILKKQDGRLDISCPG